MSSDLSWEAIVIGSGLGGLTAAAAIANRCKRVLVLERHASFGGAATVYRQLLDQVWSGVVVTPDSVYQSVASLRRTLGDDAREPTYNKPVFHSRDVEFDPRIRHAAYGRALGAAMADPAAGLADPQARRTPRSVYPGTAAIDAPSLSRASPRGHRTGHSPAVLGSRVEWARGGDAQSAWMHDDVVAARHRPTV